MQFGTHSAKDSSAHTYLQVGSINNLFCTFFFSVFINICIHININTVLDLSSLKTGYCKTNVHWGELLGDARLRYTPEEVREAAVHRGTS